MGCVQSGDPGAYLQDAEYSSASPPGTQPLGVFRLKSVHWSKHHSQPLYLQVSNYDVPDRWRSRAFVGTLDLPKYRDVDSNAKSLFTLERSTGANEYYLRSTTFPGKYVICSEYHIQMGWKHQVSAVPLHAPCSMPTVTKAQLCMERVSDLEILRNYPRDRREIFRLCFSAFGGGQKKYYLSGSDCDVQMGGKKRFCFAGPLDHKAAHVSGDLKSLWELERVEESMDPAVGHHCGENGLDSVFPWQQQELYEERWSQPPLETGRSKEEVVKELVRNVEAALCEPSLAASTREAGLRDLRSLLDRLHQQNKYAVVS